MTHHPAVPADPEGTTTGLLALVIDTTGLPALTILDRALRAWAVLVAAAETGEQLWIGQPHGDHLDRLTFNTHGPDVPTASIDIDRLPAWLAELGLVP